MEIIKEILHNYIYYLTKIFSKIKFKSVFKTKEEDLAAITKMLSKKNVKDYIQANKFEVL